MNLKKVRGNDEVLGFDAGQIGGSFYGVCNFRIAIKLVGYGTSWRLCIIL